MVQKLDRRQSCEAGRSLARLAVREVHKDLTPWYSLAITSACTAMGVAFYLGSLIRGSGFGRQVGEAYRQSGMTGFTVLVIVSLFTVVSSSKVAVSLQRKDILVWRLTGVSERQTKLVVLVEVLMATALGTVVGAVGAYALWPIWKLVLQAGDMPYAASLAWLPLGILPIVVIAIVITALLGGMRAGRVAAGMRPVELLKSSMDAKRASHWLSWVLMVCGLVAIVGLLVVVARTSADSVSVTEITQVTIFFYLGTASLFAVVVGVAGNLFVGRFLHMWTGVIRKKSSLAWFLARRQANADLEISTSLVVPLTAFLILTTGIYGYVGQAMDAAAAFGIPFAGGGIDVGSLVQLLGLPIVIVLVNAGGLAMATGQMKRKDAALLLVAGSPPKQVRLKVLFECMILTLTAVFLALMVYFVNGGLFFLVLRYGPIPDAHFIWPSLAPYVVAVLAFIVFLFASAFTYRDMQRLQPRNISN